MRFSTQNDVNDYAHHVALGALKGASVGLMASLSAAAILRRHTLLFHVPGGFHRVMIMVAPATFGGIVGADWATGGFEHIQRFRQHERKGLPFPNIMTSSEANHTTQWNRFTTWLDAHKYRCIVVGWAASLAGSFAIINRDIYLSRSQKLVQARVYAQGLTVIMLLTSVIIKVAFSDPVKNAEVARNAAENSWQQRFHFVKAANTVAPSERRE